MFGRKVQLPDVRLPDVRLPDVRLPEFDVPSMQVAGIRTPELEIRGLNVRRKRASPIWLGLKFVAGVGLGLMFGCVIAALLAPAAGEDTRNNLRGLVPKPGEGQPKLPAAKGRFQLALDEAKKQRDLKERELTAEFATAKRTGTAPL
jgi:hypothetical protein